MRFWILSLVLACTASVCVHAQQLQVVVQMNPQPSPYLSDWQTRQETLLLSITNPTQLPQLVRISAVVHQGGPTGNVLAQTKVQEMPALDLPPGVSIFNAEEVIPFDFVEFFGGVEVDAARTGRIPSGNYTLCVTLLSDQNLQPVSQPRCAPFVVMQHLPGQLLAPNNQAALTNQQLRASVFRWSRETPPVPLSHAELLVVELQQSQPLWQALSANPPVFATEIPVGLTQMQWQPDVVLPGGRTYVWSVRFLDDLQRPLTEPEWASPFTFTVLPGDDVVGCESCTGISIAPVDAVQTQYHVGNVIELNATTNCSELCIRELHWSTEVAGSPTTIQDVHVQEPFAEGAANTTFVAQASQSGTINVTCVAVIGNPDPAFDDQFPPREVVATYQLNVGGETPKNERSITITFPPNPCVGIVESYLSDDVLPIEFVSQGAFEVFDVVILDNPCGTYIPPPIDDMPIPDPPQDKFPPVTRTGPITPTGDRHTAPVTLAGALKEGAAYVVRVIGTYTESLADGTTRTAQMVSEVCERYRPLRSSADVTRADGTSAGGTREVRPPDKEAPPDGGGGNPPLPVPKLPCPKPDGCGPGVTTNPATPIEATLELKDAKTYEYPRAAPLRVNTVDWDYAIFYCDGCAPGRGEEWRPVRDLADDIKWQLKGKGSLNVPFDASAMDSINKAIEELLARMQEITDSLAMLPAAKQDAIDDLAKLQADATTQKSDRETEQTTARDSLAAIKTSLDSARAQLDSIVNKIDSLTTQAIALRDSIRFAQDSIVKYDSLLTNAPSDEEKRLLGLVATTKTALESAQSSLETLQRSIATESKTLQKAILDATKVLMKAQKDYEAAQAKAGKDSRQIADLQGRLYKTGPLKLYRASRRDLQAGLSSFNSTYPTAAGLSTINSLTTTILDETHAVLDGGSIAERVRVAALIDSLSVFVKASLLSACSPITPAATKTLCESASTYLSTTFVRYITDAKTCVLGGEVLDKKLEEKIKRERASIVAKETAIAATKAAVEAATDAHKTAIETFDSRIGALDVTRAASIVTVTTAQEAHTVAQREYLAAKETADSIFRENEPAFLDKRAQFAKTRDTSIFLIDSFAIDVANYQIQKAAQLEKIKGLSADSLDVENTLADLATEIARLDALLKLKPSDVAKPFDDAMSRLRLDSTKIADQLKAADSSKLNIEGGNKSAKGEIAYYIPPPLEVILKDEKTFEDLKDSVAQAEVDLQAALANKESLQATLVRMLESVSNNLADIKQHEFSEAHAKAELTEVSKELADLKNEETAGWKKQSGAITAERDKATADETDADRSMAAAAATAAARGRELDAKRTALNTAQSALASARQAVSDAAAAAASKQSAIQSKANTIASEGNSVNEDRKDRRASTHDELKAVDRTRRAIAKEDLAEESLGRSAAASAKSTTSSIDASIASHRATLVSLSSTLSADIKDLAAKDSIVGIKVLAYHRADSIFKKATKDYDLAFELFEAARQQIEHFSSLSKSANIRKLRASAALDSMPSADDAIKENESITAKKANEDDLTKQLDAVKKKIKDAKDAISETVGKKDSLIKDATDKITDARAHLAAKEDELRTFLLSEFNAPNHADTLIITVEDRVVDNFRADDKEKKFMCFIKYDGTRTPLVECPDLVEKKPTLKKIAGPCIPAVETKKISPVVPTKPVFASNEPRTIALVYKDGEPLWPEWPVFRETNTLAKDVTVVRGNASDNDLYVHGCGPQVPNCNAPLPVSYTAIDLASRKWTGDGTFRHVVERSALVLWEPPDPDGLCKNLKLVKPDYDASEIAADKREEEKDKFEVFAGTLVEVPDSLLGWPKKKDTVVARIVTGDHKGLPGESITIEAKLKKGKSKDWGLDGTQTTVTKKTDGDGYVRAEFDFGDGFAEFEITVKWNRDEACKKETFPAIAPLNLHFHRFSRSSPTIAWNAAKKVWEGAAVDATLKSMDAVTDDSNPYGKMIHGIVGYTDANSNFVNDQLVRFTPERPKFSIDPKEDSTELFGIARTQVLDTIEDARLTLRAECEDSLKPVCRPPHDSRTYDPNGATKFKIGLPSEPFIVEMEEGFDVNDVVSGAGKLKISTPNEFIRSLIDLGVTVVDVEVDADTFAIAGRVEWDAGGVEAKRGAFTFSLTSLAILAQTAAELKGSMDHEKLEDPVHITVALSPNGQFYGTVENLPEVEFAGFTLRKGASVTADFHSKLPAESPLGAGFLGVVIGFAELQFPESFNAKSSEQPTLLRVENLGIGNSGVSGTISLSGAPLSMSFAKFSLSVSSVSITLDANEITAGSIGGAFAMSKPFTGTVNTTLSYDKGEDTWLAEFSTESSISIPRWKAVVAIRKGSSLEWNGSKKVGTFTLSSTIQSERFGKIEIDELVWTSQDSLSVKGSLRTNYNVKILNGFDLHLSGVDIAASNSEFELTILGYFGIPGIGLKKMEGSVTIKPGPEIAVAITGGEISIKKKPFILKGTFSWVDNAFYAKLSVEIENVLKGIEGEILVGSQALEDGGSYTFWYVGLEISTAIPMGTSGLVISKIGGGIGWNCRPPIGNERPTPEFFDNVALRAVVGIGNGPIGVAVGKVFNSEFTMIYVPGEITLNGKAWLLQQEEAIMGEGRLVIGWDPDVSVSGFVRARIALPDNGGRVLLVRGKVDFEFSRSVFKIESEYLDASLLGVLNASAQFRVTPSSGFVKGKIWYELKGEAGIGVGTVKAGISLSTDGEVAYKTSPKAEITGTLGFDGRAYLSFENSLTSFDLARASLSCSVSVFTSSSKFKMSGTAKAYVSVLGFGGDATFDLGAEV